MPDVPRSKLAAALRVVVDVGLCLVAVATAALAVYLALSSASSARSGTLGDGSVWVGVGSSPIHPIQRLQLKRSDESPQLSEPTLVKARGELRFHTARFDLMLLSFLPMLVVAGAVLAGGWQLRQVLAAVARGEPFAPSNPRRIATVGWIIVGVAAMEPVLGYLPGAIVLRTVAFEGVTLFPVMRLDTGTLLTGLLILVLAAVFREGARLHEEQSLTV